ncbi:hypothetical protein pEaSNUABM37_00063 [Erwinia phage pEa_SNUABM_37]|nr:hypothetical protein pEaSNUABM37_00063 [Erwinia phage pEa_SNUABM_37]QXO10533.1 hypothetical protein pEaSNUABM48_00063 [Erwinia phage pEa_SNUABM_48]
MLTTQQYNERRMMIANLEAELSKHCERTQAAARFACKLQKQANRQKPGSAEHKLYAWLASEANWDSELMYDETGDLVRRNEYAKDKLKQDIKS